MSDTATIPATAPHPADPRGRDPDAPHPADPRGRDPEAPHPADPTEQGEPAEQKEPEGKRRVHAMLHDVTHALELTKIAQGISEANWSLERHRLQEVRHALTHALLDDNPQAWGSAQALVAAKILAPDREMQDLVDRGLRLISRRVESLRSDLSALAIVDHN